MTKKTLLSGLLIFASSCALNPFSKEEFEHLPQWISHVADAVEKLFELEWEDVASKYSIKKFSLHVKEQ
jgi:hypothetical protein